MAARGKYLGWGIGQWGWARKCLQYSRRKKRLFHKVIFIEIRPF